MPRTKRSVRSVQTAPGTSVGLAEYPSDPPPVQAPDTPRYQRIKVSDLALMVQMADEGKSQAQIAHLFNVDQATVSRHLRHFTSTADIAKRFSESRAYRSVRRIDTLAEKSGDPRVQLNANKALLEVSGVLSTVSDRPVNVAVVVGLSPTDAHSLRPSTIVDAEAAPRSS